ncbi:acyltransferase [Flavobacterium sp.]|uniref:acyltransferase family protein n=1 Tax=Flavobacterium sp. TaxID=239 RepID=UPI0025BDCC98|nr:acyltransferase [Flavobacterium sp.]
MQVEGSAKPVYFSALDGIRGLALLAVMYEHLVVDKGWFINLHFGALGVGIFFVLSGFLIGNILIQQRYQKDVTNEPTKNILKVFYIRRSLRIFPVYYLLLLVMLLLGLPHYIYNYAEWYATYTANFKLIIDKFTVWPTSHFWTLSIEEQFYLVFPLLLFLTPAKNILKLIVGFIVAGVVSRMILHFQYNYFYDYFTLSAFDYFGFGLLLAYMRIHDIKLPYPSILLLLFLCLYIHLNFPIVDHKGKSFLLKTLPIFSIIFSLILYKSITDWKDSKILNNGVLRYTGKISYGMYLYHPFVPYIRKYFIEISDTYLALTIDVCLVYAIATLSFYAIEKPLNNLKGRFVY